MFLVMTTSGTTPPKYPHHDFDLALAEAKRLHSLHNTDCMVLKIVATVKHVEVPVTRTETKVETFGEFNDEGLPF
jgi:hypothetical protein